MALIESAFTKTHSSKACIFPFTYEGTEYNDCTASGSWTGSWCPYEVDKNGGYIDSKYGYCKFSNGGDGCVEVALGTQGENTCDSSDTQIVTEAACKAAAQSLASGGAGGLKPWQGPVVQANVANSPNGCFYSSAGGQVGVYFNINAADIPGVDTQQICLKGACTTAGGKSCKFPFTYKGAEYTKCIVSDVVATDGWCPTQLDKDGGYTDDNWDYCLEACPETHYCEVADNSRCRECVPESERTGNGQCKSCNAGYKLDTDKKCERVCGDELKLHGVTVKNVKGTMGTYKKKSTMRAGRHVYELSKNFNKKTLYLYWVGNVLEGSWIVGHSIGHNVGFVKSETMLFSTSCPEDSKRWHCFDGSNWVVCSVAVSVEKHAEGGEGTSGAYGSFVGKGALAWTLLTSSLWLFGA